MRPRGSAAPSRYAGRPPHRAAPDDRAVPPARRRVHRHAAGRLATIGSNGAVAGDPQPRTARADRTHPPQPAGMSALFIDVASQLDFLCPAGALYVPGAERIVPAIAELNRYAAARGIPVLSTVDAHAE